MKKRIVVLTGAGISQESGIRTFRDDNGLWEGHDVMEVASQVGWMANPELVLDFYNKRRKQLKEVSPNAGHFALAGLEQYFDLQIVTQNVDNLHEQAGSSKVTHLHGELFQVRSTGPEEEVFDWKEDLQIGDLCPKGYQLRPHIVWFGEAVPELQTGIELARTADIFLVVGTSLAVYPANTLMDYTPIDTPIWVVDPNKPEWQSNRTAEFIQKTATEGLPGLAKLLIDLYT